MRCVFRRRVYRRLALAASSLVWSLPVIAQDVSAPAAAADPLDPGGMLDPASPLAPLPDLGVDWPDMAAPDPISSVPLAPPAGASAGAAPADAAPAAPPVRTDQIDAAAEQRYRYSLQGIDGLIVGADKIRTQFEQLSALAAEDDDNANLAQINRRAREDEAMLRELLRAYGYYDADVRTRVDGGAGQRLLVTLTAEAGEVYRFREVDVTGLAAAGDKAAALRAAFPVKVDDPVDAGVVTAAQANLRTALGRQGFPFAKVGEPDVTVDHETRLATLSLDVQPGMAARFGRIEARGRRLFSEKHLGRIARFAPGEPYDSLLIDDFRRALIQTGLVSSVVITPEPAAEPGVVDIAVLLERAPPRTIAGEIGYGTGEGIRAEVSWTHRNLIKPEGAVTFRGVAGTQEQSLSASLRRNNYKARDRVLTAQIAAANVDREAYDARTLSLGVGLERQTNIIWQKTWTWSVGAELITSDERDAVRATGESRRRTFFIGALPTSLSYDGTDDLLDARRGFRLSGRLSPEASFQGSAFGYVKAQIDASAYVPVSPAAIVAGRVRIGTIMGASRDRIAPSRRFYAGGGGSVRGFGYQRIGPRDIDNDPVGGRSLAEFAIEGRIRFGDFGVVPFFDAGNLYADGVPDFSGLRYGAGIGARYYTNFGPIRVDVGTPLNRQPGDSRVAVYVSLGQAF